MLPLIIWGWALAVPFVHANFADRHVNELAQSIAGIDAAASPLDATLMAEELYYLSHESSQQTKILDLTRSLFDRVEHPEARAEIGFLLTQMYRQLGQHDALAQLVPALGYVQAWQVLGPLAPASEFPIKELLALKQVEGLHRQVAWSRLNTWDSEDYFRSGLGHYGYLNANHAIYPNQLAGAYFAVQFELERATEIRVGLGFAHRIRVWINRTEVLDQIERQQAHPDQTVIRAKLKRGRHTLILYRESDNETSPLGFFARLTDAAGTPIATSIDRLIKTGKAKPQSLQVGLSELIRMAQTRDDDALGSLMLVKEFERHSQLGTPRDALLQAFGNQPTQRVTEKLLSLTPNANDRVSMVQRFLEVEPQSVWALAQLGQVALAQGRYWEARDYAQQAQSLDPEYWPAQILLTNTLASLRLVGESLKHTEELASRYPGVPWIMMDLCDLYWTMEFRAESEQLLDEIMAIRHGLAKYTERKMSLLKLRGDVEGLDQTYQDLLRDAPYSVNIGIEYANFLAANRRFDEASAILDKYLDQTPENPFLLQAKGELQLKNGDANSIVTLKQALALRPQNPGLERLVTALEDSSTDFYASYRIEQVPPARVFERSPIVINIDNTVVKVAPNGQSSTYHQLEYEIMDENGITELPGYSFSYAPLRQTAKLINATLVRGTEKILMTQVGRARISEPEYRMYYDLLAYQIAFPTLQVGDIIQLEYRIDDHDASNMFGDYFGDLVYFASRYPARRVEYHLLMPKGRKIHTYTANMEPEHQVTVDGDFSVYHWRKSSVPPYETEARMPGLATYMPYVSVSTFSDWQEMSRWYAQLIKPQLQLDHATKEIVRKLAEGVEDRMELVKRVHEYVVTHTRYVALEFGIHGFKPYPVNQVCTRQFGDCKDKASLMIAMLREVGVPAEIALVRTYDKGDIHTLPASLSYFNHAIAYIPEFDLYLDGTAEFSGVHELPDMDQGALTLVVDADGNGTLGHIPFNLNNMRTYEFDVEFQNDGRAVVNGELTYSGSQGPPVRQYLAIESKLDRHIQDLLNSSFPGLEVRSAQRADSGLQETIQLQFEGETKKLMHSDESGYRLPLRVLNDPLTQYFTPNSRRMFPVEVGVPREQRIRLNIATPADMSIDTLPDELNMEDENIRVAITFDRSAAHSLTVNYSLRFKNQRVQPSDYDSLRSLLLAHDQVLNQSIRWSQK